MDEPAPMRVIQRIGELDRVAQNVGGGSGLAADALGQRLPFEIFHDQEPDRLGPRSSTRARGLADVVQVADVRMIERGDRAGFAFEARPAIGIADKLFRRTLMATVRSSRVSRALYTSPMPPAPIRAQDLIRAEANAGREWHGYRLLRPLIRQDADAAGTSARRGLTDWQRNRKFPGILP